MLTDSSSSSSSSEATFSFLEISVTSSGEISATILLTTTENSSTTWLYSIKRSGFLCLLAKQEEEEDSLFFSFILFIYKYNSTSESYSLSSNLNITSWLSSPNELTFLSDASVLLVSDNTNQRSIFIDLSDFSVMNLTSSITPNHYSMFAFETASHLFFYKTVP